jgi:hypothetical protein
MGSCLSYEVTYKPGTMVPLQNSKKPHVYNHLLPMRTSEADILESNKLHLNYIPFMQVTKYNARLTMYNSKISQ